MHTDSLFYRIFSTLPELIFELLGQPAVPGYRFDSVEVKQTAFRIDGVFLPPAERSDLPVVFAEVQFQEDDVLYARLFAEVFLYLRHHSTTEDWLAIAIFPTRKLEPHRQAPYRELLDSARVHRVYLDELGEPWELPPGLGLMQLTIASEPEAPERARQVLARAERDPVVPAAAIMELVAIAMAYKFPQLSREAIAEMLNLARTSKQTRVYQEGREDGERALVLRLLARRVGTVSLELRSRVESLPLEHLEALGEALLDFESVADLEVWLRGRP